MNDNFETLSPRVQASINRYFPYLLEIRKRLLFLSCLFLIAAAIGFIHYEKLVIFVLNFLKIEGVNIVFTTPFQFFTLAVNSALFVGLLAIFPFIVYQLLSFLKPALKPQEFRLLLLPLPISLALLGIGFAYGVTIMKYVVTIFYQKSQELQIGNMLDVELLISKIFLTSLLLGLAFQFPVIITILLRLKLIKYRALAEYRQFAYAIFLIFVMLLPPTDMLSNLFLGIPLVLLFEFTLLFNRLTLKKGR